MFNVTSDMRAAFFLSLASLLVASCGGAGGSASTVAKVQAPRAGTAGANVYSIGGTVTGLVGSGAVLMNNGSGALTISANGSFTFNTALASGANYSVSVESRSAQICTITNGSGTVANASVTDIAVDCTTGHFAYVPSFASNELWVYTINSTTGTLTPIVGSPFAASAGATDIVFEASNRFAYVANADAYTVTAFMADSVTGALVSIGDIAAGTKPTSWTGPYAGAGPVSITVDPLGRFVFVANFTTQQIYAYAINSATGTLSAVPGSPIAVGGSPRKLVADRNGAFLYAINQSANVVQVYAINQTTGALSEAPGSPYPTGKTPLAIAIDPAGSFAYVANYNEHDISVYAIDPVTGALRAIPGSPFVAQITNCGVTIDPLDRFAFVANAVGTFGTLSTFAIDSSGALSEVTGSPVSAGSSPCSSAVDPTGRFVFAANVNSSNVSGYSIDATGALTALPGAPFPAGTGPATIVIR